MNVTNFHSQLVISSGDKILKYKGASGAGETITLPAPDLPPNLTKGQMQVLNKEDRSINCLTTSRDQRFLAVATENKQIVVYDRYFHTQRNFIVNRAASKLLFTSLGDILVADRTGDVYLYRNAEKSEPALLLGHLSMILDMALSECEKYIVTCDRDEKIRVSHFPNTYNIVSFCLGHDEFVTCVKIIKTVLFSASGDGTVRFWDYVKGEQLSMINANEHMKDLGLFEKFAESMDKEKVDVSALPITNMEVCSCEGNSALIAVSLFNCNTVQLYKVDLGSCKWSTYKNIELVDTLHNFCFLDNSFYIFDSTKASVYRLINDDVSPDENDDLIKFYAQHKNLLDLSEDVSITVLYKRKFDNVQEYFERKKLRLEANK